MERTVLGSVERELSVLLQLQSLVNEYAPAAFILGHMARDMNWGC